MTSAPESVQAPASPLASALRKARWRLIPLLSVCYLAAYVDRANISFAAPSMNRELHFSPAVYGLGASLFFLSYAAAQIPANRLLLALGARRWLGSILIAWGLVSGGMLFVRTPAAFYAARLLLGVAEAGFFPGAIFCLSVWFPARERARAVSLFYIAFPLSNLVMGSLAGLLLRQNGRFGLAGWQWLFLVEGLPAILLGLLVLRALTENPASASWLTAPERSALLDQLERDQPPGHKGEHNFAAALRSPTVWALGLFMFLILGSLYAINLNLPEMLTQLTGWDTGRAGFLIAAMGIVGALAMLLGAWSSDRTGERRLHMALPVAGMALACLWAGLHFHGWPAALALLAAQPFFFAAQGPYYTLPPALFSGEAAASAIGVLTFCGIIGGFVGPNYMSFMRTHGGFASGVALLALPCAVAFALILLLLRRPVAGAPRP